MSEVQFNLGENTTPTRDAYLSSLINISPNPADSRFSVLLTGIKTSKYSFQVIDMTGRVLSTGGSDSYGVDQEFDIDGSHLPDGQYALRINTDEGSTIKKFIITHPN